jgi:EpsI family protein
MSDARGILMIVLLAATSFLARPVHSRTADAVDIDKLPYTLAAWQGVDDDSLDEATAAELGADAYLTRTYSDSFPGALTPGADDVRGSLAPGDGAAAPVGLYIAYYASQRPGVSIHSPLHCLPGTGWEALEVATVRLPAAGGSAAGTVRQMTMRKNLDRAVVLYWYQIDGRSVANEVTSKLYLLSDRLRRRAGDAALVRIVVPVADDPGASAARGLAFAHELLPQLAPLL